MILTNKMNIRYYIIYDKRIFINANRLWYDLIVHICDEHSNLLDKFKFDKSTISYGWKRMRIHDNSK